MKEMTEKMERMEKEMREYKEDKEMIMSRKDKELIELRSRLSVIDQEYIGKKLFVFSILFGIFRPNKCVSL